MKILDWGEFIELTEEEQDRYLEQVRQANRKVVKYRMRSERGKKEWQRDKED